MGRQSMELALKSFASVHHVVGSLMPIGGITLNALSIEYSRHYVKVLPILHKEVNLLALEEL